MTKRILVVDDSSTMRELASMTLEVLGDYDIEEASDGVEAQKMLEEQVYDLVLTDLDMPHRGGDELIAWMKSDERTQAIPIIVLTAGVDKIRQEIAKKYPVEGWLDKPFKPNQLSKIVEKVLE